MGEAEPPRTIEEIAAAYLRAARQCQPQGPLNIAAFCAGSLIGVEMGHQLREAGDQLDHLILVDPPMPYALKRGSVPLWARLAFRRAWGFPKWLLRATLGRTGLLGAGGTPDAEFKKRLDRLRGSAEVEEKFSTPAAKKAHVALEHAFMIYRPQPYGARVEVITSRERLGMYEDPNLPWPRLLSDFTVHIGVEEHIELFTGEIASMACALQKCLSTGT